MTVGRESRSAGGKFSFIWKKKFLGPLYLNSEGSKSLVASLPVLWNATLSEVTEGQQRCVWHADLWPRIPAAAAADELNQENRTRPHRRVVVDLLLSAGVKSLSTRTPLCVCVYVCVCFRVCALRPWRVRASCRPLPMSQNASAHERTED